MKITNSCHVDWYMFPRNFNNYLPLTKQLWVRQSNNSSSPLPILLPHVSIKRSSSGGRQTAIIYHVTRRHIHQDSNLFLSFLNYTVSKSASKGKDAVMIPFKILSNRLLETEETH
jgi:hypothetical protein